MRDSIIYLQLLTSISFHPTIYPAIYPQFTPLSRMFSLKGSGASSEETKKKVEPAAPPAYSALKTTFASISLHEGDYLRLLQFPQKDIDALRGVIKQSWPKGIQKEQLRYNSCFEFKLRGEPWNGSNWTGQESIPSRILMREIFAYLFSAAWILHASNNDTLIFRQQHIAPPACDWISVTFHKTDRLRLIGASTELIASFRELLRGEELLQDEFWKEQEHNAWEFKMKGTPGMYLGEDMVKGGLLFLRMVETLETHGWSLYSNTTRHLTTQNGLIIFDNGWFCVKDKHWAPGMPLFRG